MLTPNNYPTEKRPPTIFNRIEREVAERTKKGQKVIALHVGDAHMKLPEQLLQQHPDEIRLFGDRLNRYGDTFGEQPLRDVLLDKVQQRNNIPATGIDCIQVTNGATGVLQAGFSGLLDPGMEILVLSPYWSILRVVADQAKVSIVEVTFFDALAEDSSFDIKRRLEEYITDKTGAIYINTPSNPTGVLLNEKHLNQIAEFAIERDLWVFSDEAYENFIWTDDQHISIASLPGMFNRTITVYTFSKCFGASGMRVGYGVAAPSVVSALNHSVVGSIYQVGRYDQVMAWRGMMAFEEAMQPIYNDYASTWRWVSDNMQAESMPSIGSFYFFVKLGEAWLDLSPEAKVEKMLDAGVVLSPGEYFGNDYENWARMCFTVVPPNEVRVAVSRLDAII